MTERLPRRSGAGGNGAAYQAFGSVGDRARRLAAAARLANSIERPFHAVPPIITTDTSDLDATLTKTYAAITDAGNFTYVGGTPTVYATNYYRFPVVTLPTGTGNATATRNALNFAVEFETYASRVEIVFENEAPSTYGLKFEVDGQQLDSVATPWPAVVGGHPDAFFLLDFGERAVRRIRVEGFAAAAFKQVRVGPLDRVWRPHRSDAVKVATIGDSVCAATGATLPNGGWQVIGGKLLGWTDVREVAIGGSGFVNTGPNNSTFGDATRLADLAEAAPDLLVVMSSSNDSATATATVTAAALAAFQAYRTALPSVPIIVTGAYGGGGPSAQQTANENAVKAAFDAWADSNSWWIPILTDTSGSWVFGTGTSSATNGSGNTDLFAFDGAHPNQAGHFYIGARFARAVRDSVLANVR